MIEPAEIRSMRERSSASTEKAEHHDTCHSSSA